jgi:putative two-component system response regulator
VALLTIDDDNRAALGALAAFLEPRIDAVIDTFFDRLLRQENAARLFDDPALVAQVKAAQRRHWMEHVFTANFDDTYLQVTCAMGRHHFRLGVDPLFFSSSYGVVLSELTVLVARHFIDQPDLLPKVLMALNRVMFIDLSVTTSVYYDAYIDDIERLTREFNFSLARAGEYRDYEGGLHLVRVGHMCRTIALAAGRDRQWANMLRLASPLHDLGKIGVPDSVLLKPGPLNARERALMQRHPQIGAEIIPDHPAPIIRMARRIALTHHERWDGAGYPEGLAGESIPLEGRITAICDVYDALLSPRPYKRPWSREVAAAYISENSGTMFDPELVEIFVAQLPALERIQDSYAELPDDASDIRHHASLWEELVEEPAGFARMMRRPKARSPQPEPA